MLDPYFAATKRFTELQRSSGSTGGGSRSNPQAALESNAAKLHAATRLVLRTIGIFRFHFDTLFFYSKFRNTTPSQIDSETTRLQVLPYLVEDIEHDERAGEPVRQVVPERGLLHVHRVLAEQPQLRDGVLRS